MMPDRDEEVHYVPTAKALRLLLDGIVDTVRDVHPEPAPEGGIYMAWTAAGGDTGLLMAMIDALVAADRLKRFSGHCLVLGESELRRDSNTDSSEDSDIDSKGGAL